MVKRVSRYICFYCVSGLSILGFLAIWIENFRVEVVAQFGATFGLVLATTILVSSLIMVIINDN